MEQIKQIIVSLFEVGEEEGVVIFNKYYHPLLRHKNSMGGGVGI